MAQVSNDGVIYLSSSDEEMDDVDTSAGEENRLLMSILKKRQANLAHASANTNVQSGTNSELSSGKSSPSVSNSTSSVHNIMPSPVEDGHPTNHGKRQRLDSLNRPNSHDHIQTSFSPAVSRLSSSHTNTSNGNGYLNPYGAVFPGHFPSNDTTSVMDIDVTSVAQVLQTQQETSHQDHQKPDHTGFDSDDIEIISLGSEDDDVDDVVVDEPVRNNHVNHGMVKPIIDIGDYFNDRQPNTILVNNDHTVNGNGFMTINDVLSKSFDKEESLESDDDLMILDAEEAVKTTSFKHTEFKGPRPITSTVSPAVPTIQSTTAQAPHPPYFATFNQPAPVPHVSDPDFHREELASLVRREVALSQDLYAKKVSLSRLADERRDWDLKFKQASDTISQLRAQIGGAPEDSVARINSLITSTEVQARKARAEVVNRLNRLKYDIDMYKQSEANLANISVRKRQIIHQLRGSGTSTSSGVFNSYSQFLSDDSNNHVQYPKIEDRLDDEDISSALPAVGYQANIYSDNRDLQNLIDNIKPDESLEEGLQSTPDELSVNLMKHQRMGLTWLIRMEQSKAKGGILADDMGLGKTIQTIALFIAQRKEQDLPTLIIAPVSLLRQWDAEIKSKVKQEVLVRVAIYHGMDKKSLFNFSRFKNYDIILTSYGTLSSEWKKHFKESLADTTDKKQSSAYMPEPRGGGKSYSSPFFSKDSSFNRVVLDEAQQIKNKFSLASKAVTYLKAETRFCLSGTPIQNNVEELYPFLRFLRVRPYSNETRFRSDIVIPLKGNNSNYDDYDQDRSMHKLRALLRAILLRRTKDSLIDGKPILQLPTKHIESDYVQMDTVEKSFYDSLEQGIQSKAKKLLSQKKIGYYSSMLTLLLRLRQACCHSYLVEIGEMKSKEGASGGNLKKNWQEMYKMLNKLNPEAIERIKKINDKSSDNSKARPEDDVQPKVENDSKFDILGQLGEEYSDAEEDTSTCPHCLNILSDEEPISIMGTCGHMLCESCVDSFFVDNATDEDNKGIRVAPCKECATPCKESQMIDYIVFKRMFIDGYNLNELGEFCSKYYSRIDNNHSRINHLIARDNGLTPSVKIEKCIELIKSVFVNYPGEKIIIFSQFTTLFDIMDKVLAKEGIEYLRYDGSMSVDSKNTTIKSFYQSTVPVLLLSLKAGSVGLTLTCASHVVIMDPFWNPFVEEQAMDRAHRIGQEREVHVHRLLIQSTVEARIMELQAKKKELISAALDEKGMKSVSRLGSKELGYLFGLNSLQPQQG